MFTAIDDYATCETPPDGPCRHAAAVTPSDSVDRNGRPAADSGKPGQSDRDNGDKHCRFMVRRGRATDSRP